MKIYFFSLFGSFVVFFKSCINKLHCIMFDEENRVLIYMAEIIYINRVKY